MSLLAQKRSLLTLWLSCKLHHWWTTAHCWHLHLLSQNFYCCCYCSCEPPGSQSWWGGDHFHPQQDEDLIQSLKSRYWYCLLGLQSCWDPPRPHHYCWYWYSDQQREGCSWKGSQWQRGSTCGHCSFHQSSGGFLMCGTDGRPQHPPRWTAPSWCCGWRSQDPLSASCPTWRISSPSCCWLVSQSL